MAVCLIFHVCIHKSFRHLSHPNSALNITCNTKYLTQAECHKVAITNTIYELKNRTEVVLLKFASFKKLHTVNCG